MECAVKPTHAVCPMDSWTTDYLIPGKSYLITHWDDSGSGFRIRNEYGDEIYCLTDDCAHVSPGEWKLIDCAEPSPLPQPRSLVVPEAMIREWLTVADNLMDEICGAPDHDISIAAAAELMRREMQAALAYAPDVNTPASPDVGATCGRDSRTNNEKDSEDQTNRHSQLHLSTEGAHAPSDGAASSENANAV